MKMQRFRRPPNAAPARTAVQDALSRYFAQDFFTYVIALDSLGSGQTSDGNVTLDADSDFLWQKFTALSYVNNAPVPAEEAAFSITITDTGSGRNLSNAPVPAAALAGSGSLPFILPTPKIFKASGQILVTVNNDGTDTIDSINLVFVGQKCYLKASQL